MPLILPPSGASASGLFKWEWLDPGAVLRDLTLATSPNLFVSAGSAGLGSPPVELVLEKLPTQAGGLLRYTQTQPAEIDLPIQAQASTFAALLSTVDSLRDWFDTGSEASSAPGHLRITRPNDDAVRQIPCYYAGGLEGSLEAGGPTHARLVVSLVAPDPYWTDITPTEVEYASADFGISIGVVNPGDFDAYPVWTFTGPITLPTLTNTTTGKTFGLVTAGGLNLAAGDTLTVDTRPSPPRVGVAVLHEDGTSHFDKLSAGSSLWRLVPGANVFTIATSGVTSQTRIALSYLPRYRGVLR